MAEKIPVAEGAFVVPDVLTPDECAAYIALSEKIGYEPATITTASGAELRTDVRNNDRVKTVGVKPVTGHALIFLHEMLHEGAAVSAGRKYILRTDVMYSPGANARSRGWRDQ